MPLPQAALDAQQIVIAALMVTLGTDIGLYNDAVTTQANSPSGPHAAAVTAAAAVVTADRKTIAAEVGKLPLILLQAPDYRPATEAQMFYDLAYQITLALAPSF